MEAIGKKDTMSPSRSNLNLIILVRGLRFSFSDSHYLCLNAYNPTDQFGLTSDIR